MNKSPNNDLNVVVRPTSLHLERGKTQGAAYGAQASSDPQGLKRLLDLGRNPFLDH